jgi:hypothetical protein
MGGGVFFKKKGNRRQQLHSKYTAAKRAIIGMAVNTLRGK